MRHGSHPVRRPLRHRRVAETRTLSDAVIERFQLVFVVRVVETEHRHRVFDFGKTGRRPARHALGRRIGRDEIGVLGLEHAYAEGSLAVASTYEGQHARVLLGLGSYDAAETATQRSRELGASDDIVTQVLWRQALARVLARRGEFEAAQLLAREAIARAESTDMLWTRGEARFDLADVLELAGDPDGAAAALERALDEYTQKGVIPAIERTQARLATLRAPR